MNTPSSAPLARIGRVVLTVTVLVPLVVSLFASLQIRDMRCTDQFAYTFAPLLVTCGERSPVEQLIGWMLTLITVGGLATAACLVVPVARKALAKTVSLADRVESWSYVSTVTAVLVVVGIAVASDPDRLWGRNAWVFFAAGAAALVLIISAVAGPLIRLAIARVHQRQRQ